MKKNRLFAAAMAACLAAASLTGCGSSSGEATAAATTAAGSEAAKAEGGDTAAAGDAAARGNPVTTFTWMFRLRQAAVRICIPVI